MPNRAFRRLAALAIIATLSLPETGHAGHAAGLPEHRHIHFPVEGPVRFSDDFGAPRSGGRAHEGNDLVAKKLQRLLSAVNGTVTFARADASGSSGNMLVIVDPEGWSYRYMHLNNDSPGTDDNLNPRQWIFAPGLAVGSQVWAGQHVAYLGDSGNAEQTAPHLHFEIRRPDGAPVSPWASLRVAQALPIHGSPVPPPAVPVARPAPPPGPPPAVSPRRRARRRAKARRRITRRPAVRRATARRSTRPSTRPSTRRLTARRLTARRR